jgi:hypothetical protein
MTILNFNRANLSLEPISERINTLIEQAEPLSENFRRYLGASSIGAECLRKVQYDWMCDPVFPARIKDIFARGHFFERVTRDHLIAAGFKFAPPEQLKFEAAGGLFRGHADGVIVAGPELPELHYSCLWECKCLKAKAWREIERDGLKNHPQYASQVAIYQAYLNVTDHPALFTAVNADTAERVHLTIPFDVQLAQTMSDRAVEIIRATRAGELLPRAYADAGNWHCKMCPHKARCWEQQP